MRPLATHLFIVTFWLVNLQSCFADKASLPADAAWMPIELLQTHLIEFPKKDKVPTATDFTTPQIGQFVVYSFRNSFTAMVLVEQNGKAAIEEICISKAMFHSLHLTWGEWAERGFPKALSHFRIFFSKKEQGDAQTTTLRLIQSERSPLSARLLQVLWQLPVDPQAVSSKKGVEIKSLELGPLAQFRDFAGKWPKDRSPLANQPIALRFASPRKGEAPYYWPISIRLGSRLGKEHLVAVAIGQLTLKTS